VATLATLMQRGAPKQLLLLYHHCGIVLITVALHVRSSAEIKLIKGKLPATTLCFPWWERKDISNQGEYKVESVMARMPSFTEAFKTVL